MSSSLVTLFGLTFNIYGVIILVLLFAFGLAIWSAHRQQRLDWTDLITRDGDSSKVELTKILQLVGGVVATWIVIQMTLGGTLSWDIFAIYLAYVASVEGFTKVVIAKYGNGNNGGYGGGYGGYGGGYGTQGRTTHNTDLPDPDGDNADSDDQDTRPLASKKTTE